MGFGKLIQQKIQPLLEQNGWRLSEQDVEDVFHFEAEGHVLTLANNAREHQCYLTAFMVVIEGKQQFGYALEPALLDRAFEHPVKIRAYPAEDFIEDVVAFLTGPGRGVLERDEKFNLKLHECQIKIDLEYMDELQAAAEAPVLTAADEAHRRGDYDEVIRLLSQIDPNRLSEPHRRKLDYARKKHG